MAAGPPSSRDASAERATARLFVGLWPNDATRSELRRWQVACVWPPGARPTSPERLHLTLHFLGQVDRGLLPTLGAALDLPPTAPGFALRLGSAAVWPNGVAVLEPLDPPPALFDLHRRLGAALQRCGLPLDPRPFRPHATLARRARGAVLPAAGLPAVRWRVQGHVLVESDHGYRVLRPFG